MLKNFYSYGAIASSKAIIEQKTGECKGYGFAMFENEEEAQRAIEGLNRNGLQASFARVGQVRFKSCGNPLLAVNAYISIAPYYRNRSVLVFEAYKTRHLPISMFLIYLLP